MTNKQKERLLKITSGISSEKFKKDVSLDIVLNELEKKVNLLQKKSHASNEIQLTQRRRIDEIIEVLMAVSSLDFSKRASISERMDEIDGLSTGINMMAEELKSSTISLKEKETLLKEIHHRVKNNLQLVQSLLNIQSTFIEDEKSLGKFKESMDRVRSMALIHEKLYINSNLSKIDFTEYLKSVVSQLFISYNIDPKRIKVKFDTDTEHHYLDINTAIPCGLMINEMLTNSFKYAFPKNRKGIIKVSYHTQELKNGRRKNIIKIEDNGIGFPKNFDPEESPSLGMQLITTLLEQIEGKMEIMKIQGAGLIVSFVTED